ncbi:MAG TPA: GreA/GreB family elongation factor [Flavobacteriales bacterium]|nr:GreA/GreB family elongation factor [Flavobacteriales bacterium]
MSRGFVKEDDQEEAPFIPPRAPLPDGVLNYVTPRGLRLLHGERDALERSIGEALGDQALADYDRRRTVAELEGRLALLQERIVTARVVEPGDDPPAEVRFGCAVRFRYLEGPQQGTERSFTIVGVDEADVKEGRIAFTAPIARALMGKRAGELIALRLGAAPQKLELMAITLPSR